ncbi:MAG: hypothetical protein ACREE6_10225, partial [Limisphaerales bacterium]
MIEDMRRILITTLFATLLALSRPEVYGFALLGPPSGTAGLQSSDPDPLWQTPTIGYDLPGDIGTPKNVGQGFRWNTPVLYYGFADSFSGDDGGGFFGLQGEEAVDSAFAILNRTFTNNGVGSLDGYSSNLVEFPFDSQSINYTAESLGLTDLKSVVLYFMVEELGLAQPVRYTWTLYDRYLPPGGKCPLDELYMVVQRNYYYTPTPLFENLYSPYVNDTLYTYIIEELCSPPAPPDAVTVPEAVDPFAQTDTAVAGQGDGLGVEDPTAPTETWASPEVGGFYNGLTRDDVGGLRYLMSSNNVVWEDSAPGGQLEATNYSLQGLTTLPLGPLLQFAQTNPPSAVLAAFPNLNIDSVSNYLTLVTNWNVGSYFTNYPGQPAGSLPIFVLVTNGYVVTFQTNYAYTFGNMVIFQYSSNTPALLQTVSLGYQTGQQYPSPAVTNITYQKISLNQPSGQYYLVPTNSCGFDIVVTNVLNQFYGTYTNETIFIATNNATGTAGQGFVGSENIIENLTNSLLEYYQCNFETSGPAFYQGIGRIHFVRIPDNQIDPTTDLLIQPITNVYTMVWYNPTNSQYELRRFQRVLTQPDILIGAANLASPGPPPPIAKVAEIGVAVGARSYPIWDVSTIPPNQGGPGTITGPVWIDLNDVGDIYGNGSLAENLLATNGFLSELTQGGLLAYGS